MKDLRDEKTPKKCENPTHTHTLERLQLETAPLVEAPRRYAMCEGSLGAALQGLASHCPERALLNPPRTTLNVACFPRFHPDPFPCPLSARSS